MSEKDVERKSFELRLASVSESTREKYLDLLLKRQISEAKKNKGRPITLTIEDREALLKRAEQISFYGSADPVKMSQDWERAVTNGRNPVGGAQDD